MTYIDSLPLRIIKQLIKAEFNDLHHDYKIELGALNLDDEELCPQEDEVGNLVQRVKVMVHVNSPKEDDPAQCWHPWTLIWNCNDSEFETLMRDDQTQHIDIDVLADGEWCRR